MDLSLFVDRSFSLCYILNERVHKRGECMPKIIENLDERILKEASDQLFSKGYHNMTMRSVADSCGIAVGTVYNYYKSKDLLIAQIMLKDWKQILADISLKCSSSIDIHEAFKIMYDGLTEFVAKYDVVWSQYGKTASIRRDMPMQYDMLIKQLSGILKEVLVRCYNEQDEYIPVFLAEILLNASAKRDFVFENITGILKRMYG